MATSISPPLPSQYLCERTSLTPTPSPQLEIATNDVKEDRVQALLKQQMSANEIVQARVDELSRYILRLKESASPRLRSFIQEGIFLLKEGQRAADAMSSHQDTSHNTVLASQQWISSEDLSCEMKRCAEHFVQHVELSSGALNALLTTPLLETPLLKEKLSPLIYQAVRTGKTAKEQMYFFKVNQRKVSCFFDPSGTFWIDVRQNFVPSDKKRFFTIIHLAGPALETEEVYVKICKNDSHHQMQHQTWKKRLEHEADISSTLLNHSTDSTSPSALSSSSQGVEKGSASLAMVQASKDEKENPIVAVSPTDNNVDQEKPISSISVAALSPNKTSPQVEEEDPSKYILRIRKVFHRKNPESFKGIVMEYCNAGDASSAQFSSNECDSIQKQRLTCAYQLSRAIEWMHAQGISHLDIKPENTFLINGPQRMTVRLADFEFSKCLGTRSVGRPGTWIFLPPEVLVNRVWNVLPSIDMWAFGLTLLEITEGEEANLFLQRLPPEIFSQADVVIQAMWERIHKDILSNLSFRNPVHRLIADLLNFDYTLRPSAAATSARLLQILKDFHS